MWRYVPDMYEFRKALEVFNDSIIAQQLLDLIESPFPKEMQSLPIDRSTPMEPRLEMLAVELKAWVILMLQEMNEYEGEIRLQGEAVGCM
jgi:hypothetical protein